jgi:hypothetical protein
MSGSSLQVVQFVHPGFEYHSREHVGARDGASGVMPWKVGRSRHDRKFMLTRGSLIDPTDGRNHTRVPLGFWGEWEGPSIFWRVASPGSPLPSIVHAPFRPARRPSGSVQNTDPMVFGDAFVYSNCLQSTYIALRRLTPGSIVLFGRYARRKGRPSFSLDTCLVVGHVEPRTPTRSKPDSFGADLLADVVLGPLHTEGIDSELSVYFGTRRTRAANAPFSFFPARIMHATPPLFARPELRPIRALRGVITPANMQGIKVTTGLSATERDAIWAEVARQVTRQDCGLGHHAWAPPALDSDQADRIAVQNPNG